MNDTHVDSDSLILGAAIIETWYSSTKRTRCCEGVVSLQWEFEEGFN